MCLDVVYKNYGSIPHKLPEPQIGYKVFGCEDKDTPHQRVFGPFYNYPLEGILKYGGYPMNEVIMDPSNITLESLEYTRSWNNESMTVDIDIPKYISGFHVFLNEKDAHEYQENMVELTIAFNKNKPYYVYKVEFDLITAIGLNGTNPLDSRINGKMAQTMVVKQIKILERLPDRSRQTKAVKYLGDECLTA